MLFWLIASLALHIAQIFTHALLRLGNIGVAAYVGPRDALGPPGRMEGRAMRAFGNWRENLPVFLTLGLLALVVDGADTTLAALGAAVFVLARAVYFGAYLTGIPWLRSPLYGVGLAGCAIMLAAIF